MWLCSASFWGTRLFSISPQALRGDVGHKADPLECVSACTQWFASRALDLPEVPLAACHDCKSISWIATNGGANSNPRWVGRETEGLFINERSTPGWGPTKLARHGEGGVGGTKTLFVFLHFRIIWCYFLLCWGTSCSLRHKFKILDLGYTWNPKLRKLNSFFLEKYFRAFASHFWRLVLFITGGLQSFPCLVTSHPFSKQPNTDSSSSSYCWWCSVPSHSPRPRHTTLRHVFPLLVMMELPKWIAVWFFAGLSVFLNTLAVSTYFLSFFF